jgi:hypothetical protein
MASEMIDMCSMGGSDLMGGVPVGTITDVYKSHPDAKVPAPGLGPAMVHGTGMAGQVIGAPASWPMSAMK